jgi:hypothetical protein
MDCVLSEDDFGVVLSFFFWCQIRHTLKWNSCTIQEIIIEIDIQIEISIEVEIDVDVDVGALIVWHGTWIWKNSLYPYPLP